MKILTDTQMSLLAFVHCCELGDGHPTSGQIESWLKSPRPDQSSILSHMSALQGVLSSALMSYNETDVAHAKKCEWITESRGRISLTSTGRALLKGSEKLADEGGNVEVVILKADDPLAYPKLIGALASYGDALLVDPYLGLEELDQITNGTSISRVLVSNSKRTEPKRKGMAAYLASTQLTRDIEVRASDGLHDRQVFTEDKKVFMLGTSLNGVGKSTTMLSPVPEPGASAMNDHYSTLWDAAVSIALPETAVKSDGPGNTPKK